MPMEEGRGFKGRKTNSTSRWDDRRRAFVQSLFLPESDHQPMAAADWDIHEHRYCVVSAEYISSENSTLGNRASAWEPVMDDVMLVAGVDRYLCMNCGEFPKLRGWIVRPLTAPLRTAAVVHMTPQLVPNSRALHPIASHLPPSTLPLFPRGSLLHDHHGPTRQIFPTDSSTHLDFQPQLSVPRRCPRIRIQLLHSTFAAWPRQWLQRGPASEAEQPAVSLPAPGIKTSAVSDRYRLQAERCENMTSSSLS